MRITLANDFHNTSVALNADVRSHIYHTATAYLTPNQVKKARKALCGVAECKCAEGAAGHRGRQTANGKRLEINVDSTFANV